MNESVYCQSKRLEENCIRRYPTGLRNQYREHHVNLCESNILQAQAIFPLVN